MILVILLGAGGTLGFFFLQSARGQSEPSATSGPVPSPVAQAVQNIPGDPAGYLSSQSPLRSAATSAFPPGTITRIVQDTWSQTVDDQGLVQVDITRPGKNTEKYAAMMVLEDGRWKVLATVPVGQ